MTASVTVVRCSEWRSKKITMKCMILITATALLILSSATCGDGFAAIISNQHQHQHHNHKNPRWVVSSSSSSSTSLHMEINTLAAVTATAATVGGILYMAGADDRAQQQQLSAYEEKVAEIEHARKRKAYIAPKEYWDEAELKQYDGNQDPDGEGPILLAADGKVFNVYRGRHFYGPGCEYALFAGRDATRLLAKQKLEEETEDEKARALNLAEKATLAGWMWTFDGKYEVVGKLKEFDATSTELYS